MAFRSTAGQNAHDKGVYREAMDLRREGWYVMADHIPGFDRPPEIEGYTPDIYALKAEITYIIEIETSFEDDIEQHSAFIEYARDFPNIKFMLYVVDIAGRRIPDSANETVCKEKNHPELGSNSDIT